MNYDEVRDLLVTQWTYTGGPNEDKAAEWYTDETVLEFPQSGERFRGREHGSSSSPGSYGAAATCGSPRPACATTAASPSA